MSRYHPRRLGVRSRCWVSASMEMHGPRQTTVTVVGTIHASTSVGLPRTVPEEERDTRLPIIPGRGRAHDGSNRRSIRSHTSGGTHSNIEGLAEAHSAPHTKELAHHRFGLKRQNK